MRSELGAESASGRGQAPADPVERMVSEYASHHPELVEWMRLTREAIGLRDRAAALGPVGEPIARYSRVS